jgi:glucose/arabinose dehydrogenase
MTAGVEFDAIKQESFFNRGMHVRRATEAIYIFVGVAILFVANVGAQSLSGSFAVEFSLSPIGSSLGGISQMAFAPGDTDHLYLTTFGEGIWRYDYAANGGLTGGVKVVEPSVVNTGGVEGSLGIAFHQDPTLGLVMYIAPAVPFMGGAGFDDLATQTIVRLTDAGGNGVFGDQLGDVNQVIVNNVQVSLQHQINQMRVIDNSLFVAIGARTSNGGVDDPLNGGDQADPGEAAYTGAVNFIDDLTLLSGDTTTMNLAGFNIANHKTDTQSITSTDSGKLRVYSTGFRNNYGLAVDSNDELWVSMNQQGPNAQGEPNRPDELHHSAFRDDHGFAKANDEVGDWKTNAAAVGAGYFQNSVAPVATLGSNSSSNGFEFLPMSGVPVDLEGDILIARRQPNDVWIVDPVTGATDVFATGLNRPMDVLRDPFGNMLIAEGAFGGGRLFRVKPAFVTGLLGDYDNSGTLDAIDWTFFRSYWGTSDADLNSDLTTDELDFALFKNSYIRANGTAAFRELASQNVPEPTSALVFGIGLASLILQGWSRRTLGGFDGERGLLVSTSALSARVVSTESEPPFDMTPIVGTSMACVYFTKGLL